MVYVPSVGIIVVGSGVGNNVGGALVIVVDGGVTVGVRGVQQHGSVTTFAAWT
jgi:hypothetical protein